jgi:glycosyltransferase involved in cell wall biosynthesis
MDIPMIETPSVDMPLISVVIPAFNAERFIGSTLASLQRQTYTHWEAWVVDDHSTDNTAEVIKGIAASDSRINYVKGLQPMRRPSSNRNIALNLAKGEFITFMDADDEYLPTGLATLAQPLINDPNLNVSMAFPYWCNANLQPLHPSPSLIETEPGKYAFSKTFAMDWVNICENNISFFLCCTMMRRQAQQQVGLMDETLTSSDDFKFIISLYALDPNKFLVLPTCTYYYRNYVGSITKTPERLVRSADGFVRLTDWLFDLPSIPEQMRSLKGLHLSKRLSGNVSSLTKLNRKDLALQVLKKSLNYPYISVLVWLKYFGPEIIRILTPKWIHPLLSRLRGNQTVDYYQSDKCATSPQSLVEAS